MMVPSTVKLIVKKIPYVRNTWCMMFVGIILGMGSDPRIVVMVRTNLNCGCFTPTPFGPSLASIFWEKLHGRKHGLIIPGRQQINCEYCLTNTGILIIKKRRSHNRFSIIIEIPIPGKIIFILRRCSGLGSSTTYHGGFLPQPWTGLDAYSNHSLPFSQCANHSGLRFNTQFNENYPCNTLKSLELARSG